jgi:hypothetical protein
MGRKNNTNRRCQTVKGHVEDRMARRAVRQAVEASYREEARQTRLEVDHTTTLVFTDASFIRTDLSFLI